jgi:hypothetical protein
MFADSKEVIGESRGEMKIFVVKPCVLSVRVMRMRIDAFVDYTRMEQLRVYLRV